MVSGFLGICAGCIKEHFDEVLPHIKRVHGQSQGKYGLPGEPPKNPLGIPCNFCVNECRLGEGEKGFCGLRRNRGGKLETPTSDKGYLSWYYDPLPTNCVGDWVCPGGTGAGYPEFSNSRGPEYGYKNLAVFYHGCTFNCLFCQNWHFREYLGSRESSSAADLSAAVDAKTSCICYFGGDPTPQLPHAVKASELALDQAEGRKLRICWETNGAMNPRLLEKMLNLSLKSGGCVKFDLKAWDERLQMALCGVGNRRTLDNFALAAKWIGRRKEPPLVIASTLMVPGYVDEQEVSRIAKFIAGLDLDIPYALLGFGPHFHMPDLPCTSRAHAEKCYQAALDAGLKRVRIGNAFLLGSAY